MVKQASLNEPGRNERNAVHEGLTTHWTIKKWERNNIKVQNK